MLINLLSAAGGLVFLFIGGELLVRGSVAVARRFGLSEIFVGLTVVGFGTSAPEFLVSLDAVLRGAPEVALGNVVGSNFANTLLIIGAAAAIVPLVTDKMETLREAAMGVAASVLLLALVQGQAISRLEGLAMVALITTYLFVTYRRERRNGRDAAEDTPPAPAKAWLGPLMALGGLVMLVGGAELLVSGAVAIAQRAGVPEGIIGMTMVALGTSLPELATVIAAAINRRPGVVLGNVLGSNIFNILAILGLTAAIVPIETSPHFRGPYTGSLVVLSLALLALLHFSRRIGRRAGVAMISAYVAYTVFLFAAGPGY